MSLKYTIILPYFDKLSQFELVAQSYKYHYGTRDDFEVILIEDCKNFDSLDWWLSHNRGTLPANFIHLRERPHADGSRYWTAGHLWHFGAESARGEILLFTLPEAFHARNILAGLDAEFAGGAHPYVNCACESVADPKYDGNGNIHYKSLGWLQHSKLHHHLLNYCGALRKADYFALGGFDPVYSPGLGGVDNDFRDRVCASMLDISARDDLLVLHLAHKPMTDYLRSGHIEELRRLNTAIWQPRNRRIGHYRTHLQRRTDAAKRAKTVG